MKFGVREIAEVVLRAKSKQKIGKRTFYRNDPVIYFDSLSTTSLEGAATTNYAQGGRGNARLMAWEGERTLTFNMTDALLSPESFMILSGAGLVEASKESGEGRGVIYVHTTSQVEVTKKDTIDIPKLACWSHSGEMLSTDLEKSAIPARDVEGAAGAKTPGKNFYHDGADIFIMVLKDGEMAYEPSIPEENGVAYYKKTVGTGADGEPIYEYHTEITCKGPLGSIPVGSIVLVDYYVKRTSGVKQIEITPDKFGGYYYLEGSTLFRRESDGKDLPAEIIIPKVKIQSNFTFTMTSTGDPSTFDFVMDAFPDYTKFDGTKKVLAIMQIVESDEDETAGDDTERRPHGRITGGSDSDSLDNSGFDHFSGYVPSGYSTNYPNDDDSYATHEP